MRSSGGELSWNRWVKTEETFESIMELGVLHRLAQPLSSQLLFHFLQKVVSDS